MPKTPVELADDLMFLLAQASYALTTELASNLAELGITPRDYCILTTATRGDLTQSQLAELCSLDKTTMVVTMDALEKAGLAARRLSDSDRRARVIAVTDAGVEVVDKARHVVAGIYQDVLAGLPAGDRNAFVGALVQLVEGRLSTPLHTERSVRRRTPRSPNLVP